MLAAFGCIHVYNLQLRFAVVVAWLRRWCGRHRDDTHAASVGVEHVVRLVLLFSTVWKCGNYGSVATAERAM